MHDAVLRWLALRRPSFHRTRPLSLFELEPHRLLSRAMLFLCPLPEARHGPRAGSPMLRVSFARFLLRALC
jgi:hypothetical protein